MEMTTMADKLHDIKIDELDSPKKTPLKNILTLLALLFIILVISVVITRLILGTDSGKEVEENANPSTLTAEVQADKNESLAANVSNGTKAALAAAAVATTAAVASNAKKVPVVSNILERNNSSSIKTPLRTHEPVKEIAKAPKTYKTPKHSSKAPKHVASSSHKVPKHVVRHTSTPKKKYEDKVVIKKSPKHSSTTSHTSSKKYSSKSSYLGGKEKKLSRAYYIQVGSYQNTKTILSKVKRQNFNYALQHISGKKLTRVFVGPFSSSAQAAKNLSKVKAHILKSAYVKKVTP